MIRAMPKSSALAPASPDASSSLPMLVRQAAAALARAETSAEVLDARDKAALAYDAAKSTARLQKARRAHDDLIAATHRTQADALEIEAMAKRRLADEFDGAQDRGDVVKNGRPRGLADGTSSPTRRDLGLTGKQIFEARQIRDYIAKTPGALRHALDDLLTNGAEPTRAFLRREIAKVKTRQRPEAPPSDGYRLSNGRLLTRICLFELAALEASAAQELEIFRRVRGHVANAVSDARIGDIIGSKVLAEIIAESRTRGPA